MVSASVRGIGVAVIDNKCGTRAELRETDAEELERAVSYTTLSICTSVPPKLTRKPSLYFEPLRYVQSCFFSFCPKKGTDLNSMITFSSMTKSGLYNPIF